MKSPPRKRRPARRPTPPALAPSAPANPQTWIAPAIVIVVLAVVAQMRSLPGGFVWDDAQMISNGRLVQASDGLYSFWFTTKPPDYWPVAYTTHWFEWRIWGTRASGYRALNLALHVVNAILVWRILLRLGVRGAWLCAAIFAVHPVTVEAVAWILQRKTLLSTAGALGALLCFLRYDDARRHSWYIAALALFTLGMLSKTSVVLWPVVLLICRWWQTRRLERRDVVLVLPFVAIALLLGVVGFLFQHYKAIGDVVVRDDSLGSRILLAGRVVWFYLGKAFWPLRLSFIYPRWELEPRGWQAWVPDLALAVIFGVLWRFRRGWGAAGLAGLGYYVLNLVPVMGLVNIFFMRYSLVADHWQYLALPGLIALVVGSASYLIERDPFAPARKLAWAGAVLVLILLTAQSYAQAGIYRGETNEPIWRDTLAKNPRAWMAHNNLGYLLGRRKRFDEAIAHYQTALGLNPRCADAENNWATALSRQGDRNGAIDHYLAAVRISPRFSKAHYNLASTLVEQGRLDDAVAHFQEAIRHAPEYDQAHNNLGTTLLKQGKRQQAIDHFLLAVASNPSYADAHANLGKALADEGRVAEALAHYRQALEIQPDHLTAHADLGALLVRQRQFNEAMAHYRVAVAAKPDLPELHFGLGAALGDAGRLDEAIAEYKRALALKGDYVEAWTNLANAYALAGRMDEAFATYQKAIEANSDFVPAHANLASVLAHERRFVEAIEQYRAVLSLDAGNRDAAHSLAWLLATRPEEALGNPAEAVRLAEQVCASAGEVGSADWDTLAAAYAAAGRYTEAVSAADKAIERLIRERQPELARQVEARKRLYASRQAYREE